MIKALTFLASVAALVLTHDHHGHDHGHDKGDGVPRAIVHLVGNDVEGNVTFTALDNGNISITGRVVGMPPGLYGFHIHDKGNINGGCDHTGDHFNPEGKEHGHPNADERHVGDLGNLLFNEQNVSVINFTDHKIKLSGPHNIIGRSLVLRSETDDYGLGGHHDSKEHGHSGKRVACGVIGILSEALAAL